MPGEVRGAAREVRKRLAKYKEKEDLLLVGAYQSGQDADLDLAIATRPQINSYLQQDLSEPSGLIEAQQGLVNLASLGIFN